MTGCRSVSDFSEAESLVNSTTTGFQGNPQVVALAGGGYVIVWNDGAGSAATPSGSSVRAQLYADDGTRIGDEFLVNQATAGNQSLASVIALADGGFAVGWTSYDLGYTMADGLARVFTAAGARWAMNSRCSLRRPASNRPDPRGFRQRRVRRRMDRLRPERGDHGRHALRGQVFAAGGAAQRRGLRDRRLHQRLAIPRRRSRCSPTGGS